MVIRMGGVSGSVAVIVDAAELRRSLQVACDGLLLST